MFLKNNYRLILFSIIIALLFGALYIGNGISKSEGDLYLPLDDPYIFFAYAENAANGYYFRYNIEDGPGLGITSLLYYGVCSFGQLIGFRENMIVWFTHTLAILLLAASLYLAIIFYKKRGVNFSFFAAFLTFCVGKLLYGSFCGMEIPIQSFLLFALCFTYIEKKRLPLIISMILLSLVRPEGFILILLLSPYLAFTSYKEKDLKSSSLYLIPLLTGIVIYGSVFLYTGQFFSTAAQKSPFFTNASGFGLAMMRSNDNYSTILRYFWSYGTGMLPITTLIFLSIVKLKKREWILPGVFLFGIFVEGFLAFGMWHHQRYIMPFIPVGMAILILGMERSLKEKKSLLHIARIFLFIFICWTALHWADIYGDNCRDIKWTNGRFLEFNNACLEPSSVLLVSDAGLMKYGTDHYVMDFFGLGTTMFTKENNMGGSGCVFESLRNYLRKEENEWLRKRQMYAFTYWRFGGYAMEKAARWEPAEFLKSAKPGDLIAMAIYDNCEGRLDMEMMRTLRKLKLEWPGMTDIPRNAVCVTAYTIVGDDKKSTSVLTLKKSIEMEIPKELTGGKYIRLAVKASGETFQSYIEGEEDFFVRPTRPFQFAIINTETGRIKNVLSYKSTEEQTGVAEFPQPWLPFFGYFGFRHHMGEERVFAFKINPDFYDGTLDPNIPGSMESIPVDTELTSSILNLADLESEKKFDFTFTSMSKEKPGTAFVEKKKEPDGSYMIDGGRWITGGYSFTVSAEEGKPFYMLGRFTHGNPVRTSVSVNGKKLEKNWFIHSGYLKDWHYDTYMIPGKYMKKKNRISMKILKTEFPDLCLTRLWLFQKKEI
jgi:hypothetical protein